MATVMATEGVGVRTLAVAVVGVVVKVLPLVVDGTDEVGSFALHRFILLPYPNSLFLKNEKCRVKIHVSRMHCK